MLSILRRNAGSWAIKIILSFIALTFIWWGVGTYSEQDRNVAATVGGETITTNELSEAVAGLEKTYREVYGPAFTPEMAKALDLKKQAMDSLVQRKILLAEAAKMGLSATDEEVQREIAAVPAFQQNGQFRDELYRSVLSYNRVTPAEFEASKRVEITMKKVEGLLAAGALVPETEAKELFRVASRKIRLLVVTADPGKSEGRRADRGGDPREIRTGEGTFPDSGAGEARRRRLHSRSLRPGGPAVGGRDQGVPRDELRPVPHRGAAAGLAHRPALRDEGPGRGAEEGGGDPRQGVEGEGRIRCPGEGACPRERRGGVALAQGRRRGALGAAVPGLRGHGGRAGRASRAASSSPA